MIKAIFFDVDGTLLADNPKRMLDSTYNAILKLKEKGIKMFISTGRHLTELIKLPLRDIVFDGYITLNGQICRDSELNYLAGSPFDEETSKLIVKLFNEKERPLVLVEEKKVYLNCTNDYVKRAQAAVSAPVPPIMDYQGGAIYQASVYVTKDEEESFSKRLPSSCKLTRWSDMGADIIAKDGGKSVGIAFFLDNYGIKTEEAMAFGDADNDIDMLKSVGIGIAMGNANDRVKANADYITEEADKDGILNALMHFDVL